MTTMQVDDSAVPMMARGVLLSSIMPSLFLAMIDQTIVSTVLPSIGASLGNFERIVWIVVVCLGATAIFAPVYGRLGDVLGRRRLMTVALTVSLTGSLLCAAARPSNFWLLRAPCKGLAAAAF